VAPIFSCSTVSSFKITKVGHNVLDHRGFVFLILYVSSFYLLATVKILYFTVLLLQQDRLFFAAKFLDVVLKYGHLSHATMRRELLDTLAKQRVSSVYKKP
jgi:hypothetical protein